VKYRDRIITELGTIYITPDGRRFARRKEAEKWIKMIKRATKNKTPQTKGA